MEICDEFLYNKHKNNHVIQADWPKNRLENRLALFGVNFCNVKYKGEM